MTCTSRFPKLASSLLSQLFFACGGYGGGENADYACEPSQQPDPARQQCWTGFYVFSYLISIATGQWSEPMTIGTWEKFLTFCHTLNHKLNPFGHINWPNFYVGMPILKYTKYFVRKRLAYHRYLVKIENNNLELLEPCQYTARLRARHVYATHRIEADLNFSFAEVWFVIACVGLKHITKMPGGVYVYREFNARTALASRDFAKKYIAHFIVDDQHPPVAL